MTELPILCNTQVVKNILAGTQTQDRRLVKPQPEYKSPPPEYDHYTEDEFWGWSWWKNEKDGFSGVLKRQMLSDKGLLYKDRPPCQVGDVLYLQEPFQILRTWYKRKLVEGVYLNSDPTHVDEPFNSVGQGILFSDKDWKRLLKRKWPHRRTQGRFMYKSLARTWLPVTGVRCERIRDISEEDAKSEGVFRQTLPGTNSVFWRSLSHGNWHSHASSAFQELWNTIYPGSWARNDFVWITEFKLSKQGKG